ncbi:uncharacterized protein LOC114324927 [Diabrotica virgifera virgifera]|uniref:Uncharacterized protein LOC114324927 n=1 Tax=Diabrotica virgifera virgifera TaxID=50390 RepID=A0A6P7F498_DIAVI|nr:uncharacterized protein LOC114324927 [Diabrotica virgifera virgifera]
MESYRKQNYSTTGDSQKYPTNTYSTTYNIEAYRRTLEENKQKSDKKDSERFEGPRQRISGAQKRKLRKMRADGIDTSKFKLPPRPQSNVPRNVGTNDRTITSSGTSNTHSTATTYSTSYNFEAYRRTLEENKNTQDVMQTHSKDTNLEAPQKRPSVSQRRKLWRMRKQGIDTSKVIFPPKPQKITIDNAEIAQAVEQTVFNLLQKRRPTTSSSASNTSTEAYWRSPKQNKPTPSGYKYSEHVTQTHSTDTDRSKLSGSQRRILQRMRSEGIDTTNFKLPPRPRNTPYAAYYAEVTKGLKRTRETTEKELTKRSKPAPIKTAVIPREYPDKIVAENDVGAIQDALTKLIDEAPSAPVYEKNRLMDGYYGLICADEESFRITKDYLEENTPWKVVKTEELPKSTKYVRMLMYLPNTKNDDLTAPLARLEKQNPGLRTNLWMILSSEATADEGLHVSLRIDKESEEVLKRLEWKPYFLLQRASFKPLD